MLPATSQSLRELALMRGNNQYSYNINRPISFETEHAFSQLIIHEAQFAKRREQIKKDLLKRDDFFKKKAFLQISNNEEDISLDSLINFLEGNGFLVRREDIEAILRRVDHNANQRINYEEFTEITSVNEFNEELDQ